MNTIHFIGYNAIHPSDFVFESNGYSSCYLLVLTTTAARFHIHGQIYDVPGNTAILYPPGSKIRYESIEEYFGNDWIRFSSDETFAKNFPLTEEPFSVSDPEYCHHLIQLITWEISQFIHTSRNFQTSGIDSLSDASSLGEFDLSYSSGQIIHSLLWVLFQKLTDTISNPIESLHDHELLQLRKEIVNSPQADWNISKMAAQLHISAGYLQLLYKQKYGISCMDDIISLRLTKAKDLLIHTNDTISTIADECGYPCHEYFCRQFKQRFHMTPSKFRNTRL